MTGCQIELLLLATRHHHESAFKTRQAMTETIQIVLLGHAVTLIVAIGGWQFAYRIHVEQKRLANQTRRIQRLEEEVRARIALEKTACEWLATLTDRTSESIKRELRARTQERSGLRPKLSSHDVNESLT